MRRPDNARAMWFFGRRIILEQMIKRFAGNGFILWRVNFRGQVGCSFLHVQRPLRIMEAVSQLHAFFLSHSVGGSFMGGRSIIDYYPAF